MDIRIKSIYLLNFKGQRNTSLEFGGENRSLLGANATGKSTMFDAFTWALFGKDSKGAAQFDIKTLTPDGKVIWKLPHSVTVELLVDGKLIVLRKEYEEKWVKTRGETEEAFRGHEVNRFWNDVPCTATEYDKKVAELCEESLFRLITNPSHFNSLDDKEKMRLLNMLEGNTTDEQFMAASKEFADFLNILDGKTLEEYKRELAIKISAVNKELTTLETRLDENKHTMPVEQNWASIEADIAKCDAEIQRYKGLQTDHAKQSEEQGKGRMQVQEAINFESLKLQSRENAIREEINADYYKRSASKRELQGQFDGVRQELAGVRRNIDTLTERRDKSSERLEVLKCEYKAIHGQTFTFDDTLGVCSTCHQSLPTDSVEATRQKLLENFNTNKAARLQTNIDEGNNVQTELKGINELLGEHEEVHNNASVKLKELEANPVLLQELKPADPTPRIEVDVEAMTIRGKIDELKQQLDSQPMSISRPTEDYAGLERECQGKRADFERQLYLRTTIKTAHARITEIEESIRSNGQYLLDLQRDDNTIKEIQKSKALYVESRVNSQFSMVRFKMIDPQINGGERQVCETTVNGVPYNSLNNGARINAGLDIINAFSRLNGIYAPCFIDNSEAVNQFISMNCQMICLRVTEDKQLILQ